MHSPFRILWWLVFLYALYALGVGAAVAEEKGCSPDQAKLAESETDNLKTWESVYSFYKRFAPCDDGGVAEGVSDHVAKLFANQWATVSGFVTLADNDQGFKKFVLRHVDATIDWTHDGPKIRENARSHCPSNLNKLCKNLLQRAVPPREMGPK